MGSGYSKMKKQAKQMQQQMQVMQDKLKNLKETGIAGNGLVKVTLNGEKKMLAVEISPDCVDKDDLEGLQDLIIAAHLDALQKIESQESSMGGMGGMGLPF